MGKAKIQNHLGDGLYFVSYYKDVEYATAQVAALEKKYKELETSIYKTDGLNDQLVDQTLIIEALGIKFVDALDAWKVCASTVPPCKDEAALLKNALTTGQEKAVAINKWVQISAKISAAKAEMLTNLNRRAFFENYGTSQASVGMNVWCADSPHDEQPAIPTGTIVGTIETYGARSLAGQNIQAPDPQINIQPSWQNKAPYNIDRDYKIQPMAAESVATSINNILQWLWVETKNPLYEIGTLTFVNEQNDTGNVECYGNTLTTRSPPGYPYDGGDFKVEHVGIPIVYQNCNSKVFETGDQVIVKYYGANREGAKVIGFASNPVECKYFGVSYTIDAGGNLLGDVTQEVFKGDDGTPVEIQLVSYTDGFRKWSDNRLDYPVRVDTNVQANISVNAELERNINWPSYIDMFIDAPWGGACMYGNDGGGGSHSISPAYAYEDTQGNETTYTYSSEGIDCVGCVNIGVQVGRNKFVACGPINNPVGFFWNTTDNPPYPASMLGEVLHDNEWSYSQAPDPEYPQNLYTVSMTCSNWIKQDGKIVTTNWSNSAPWEPDPVGDGVGTMVWTQYADAQTALMQSGLATMPGKLFILRCARTFARRAYGAPCSIVAPGVLRISRM